MLYIGAPYAEDPVEHIKVAKGIGETCYQVCGHTHVYRGIDVYRYIEVADTPNVLPGMQTHTHTHTQRYRYVSICRGSGHTERATRYEDTHIDVFVEVFPTHI